MVEFTPLDATFGPGGAPGGVNPDALHPAQVNHQSPVTHAVARDIMAATAHRHQQTVGAGEVDGVDHIGDASAAGNERRPLVDIGIPDLAGLIVAGVAGTEEWATQAGLESLYGGLVKDQVCPSGRSNSQVWHGYPPFGWCICQGAALDPAPRIRTVLAPLVNCCV
jgi:hypothetical protein